MAVEACKLIKTLNRVLQRGEFFAMVYVSKKEFQLKKKKSSPLVPICIFPPGISYAVY